MKKNTILKLTIITAMTVFICACSDPRDTTLPSDMSSWKSNRKITKSIKKLPDNEKKLLVAYCIRNPYYIQGIGDNETVITVGEAIDIQQELQKKQQEEKEEQRFLNDALTVSLLDLSCNRNNMFRRSLCSIKIGFRNNTDVNISGAKGVVILKDMFGEIIKKINLTNDSGITANDSMVWSGTMEYQRFKDSDKKLYTTEFEKIKFEWVPDIYLFEDGKKISNPYCIRTKHYIQGIRNKETVGEAINILQKLKKEQRKEKEKQRILNDALTVSLLDLSCNKSSNLFEPCSCSIKVNFRNNTDVNISGAKGVVIFKDMFGEIIKKINLTNDSGITANDSMVWSGTMECQPLKDSEKKLYTTEFEKIKFEWVPDIYLFEDGKKISNPCCRRATFDIQGIRNKETVGEAIDIQQKWMPPIL